MVRLYGVIHSQEVFNFGTKLPIVVTPSLDFLEDIATLPKGSRIGVESLTRNAWKQIKDDLSKKLVDAKFDKSDLTYDKRALRYWTEIIGFCKSNKYKVVLLEDTSLWHKYNSAQVRWLTARRNVNSLPKEFSGSDIHKLILANEEEYRTRLFAREIHEIKRDKQFFDMTISSNLEAVVIGMGHSDHWFSRLNDTGIFTQYSTSIPNNSNLKYEIFNLGLYSNKITLDSIFTKDAVPSNETIINRDRLERGLRVINQGRVIDGRLPDYVGTWNIFMPSLGYFEMFIEKIDGQHFSGTIEDCVGTASFHGEITSDSVNFRKLYIGISDDGPKSPINYEGRFHPKIISRQETKTNPVFIGTYSVNGIPPSTNPDFVLAKSSKENPVDLTLAYVESLK